MTLSINLLSGSSLGQTSNFKTKSAVRQNPVSLQSDLPIKSLSNLSGLHGVSQVSFGSLEAILLEKRLNTLAKKYSTGENPLILSMKEGFINRLAKKAIQSDKPLIVGVSGQSASGKSTLLEKANEITPCSLVRGDDYYHDTSEFIKRVGGFEEMTKTGFSFDVPDAVNLKLLNEDIKVLSDGKSVMIPKYDFVTTASIPSAQKILPSKVILIDSIFALTPQVRDVLDVGVYVRSTPEVIKERWFNRAASRGKFGEVAIKQFADVSKKAEEHIIPTSKTADIILSGESSFDMINSFFNELKSIFAKK